MVNVDDIRLSEADLLALLGFSQAQLELSNRKIRFLQGQLDLLQARLDSHETAPAAASETKTEEA